MPKVTFMTPASEKKPAGRGRKEKKQLEDKIIDLFGMCLTMKDLMKVLGMRDYHCAKNWLIRENIEPVEVNGRKRYLATDIARALDNSKTRVV